MRLTIRILGLEFFHVELTDAGPEASDVGDVTTMPVGFAVVGEQRYDVVPGGET